MHLMQNRVRERRGLITKLFDFWPAGIVLPQADRTLCAAPERDAGDPAVASDADLFVNSITRLAG